MRTKETSGGSPVFRLRRVSGVIVIESLSAKLSEHEALKEVIGEILEEKIEGVILHLPTPTYVSSLFLLAMVKIAEEYKQLGTPFYAVMHPKMRLLVDMFNLSKEIPYAERLDRAIEKIKAADKKS